MMNRRHVHQTLDCQQGRPVNKPRQILFASMVGTLIEYFDFYIYGTAAVLVFPHLFFPTSDPAAAALASFATFGIAFLARPIGATLFGHFGDRVGRKTTLVAALLTMGISTVIIGLLPTYEAIGIAAPLLLAICRFGQGIGLGGEWGGAVLLAVENAPAGKRDWYGMFPQLGAPVGLFLSTGVFILLTELMTDEQFLSYGWRIPFLASALLILVGLYVRLSLEETPVFQNAVNRHERVRMPVLTVLREYPRISLAATLASLTVFVLFYLMNVFALSWGTSRLGYPREQFLLIQLLGVIAFAAAVPLSALLAKHGRRRMLMGATSLIAVFGLVMAPLLEAGLAGVVTATFLGMLLMGFVYGPLGTLLSEQFPTAVRYTGSSLTFNMAGILGASFAPYIATWLADRYGLQSVGYYLIGAALLTFVGLLALRETRTDDL